MHSKWMLSERVSRILLACSLSVFLVGEAVVVVASLGLPKGPSLGIGRILVNVLLTSIPGLAGIRGYYVVKRLRSNFDAERQEATFVWLSRQFLAVTISAYAVVVSIVASLSGR